MTTVELFHDAMRNAGLDPEAPPFADSTFRRVRDRQDRPGKTDLWYILHGDGVAAGEFGHHARLPYGQKWTAKAESTFTPEERRQWQERMQQNRQARDQAEQEKRSECRKVSAELLAKGQDVAADHPYIVKKGIRPYGARQWRDMLMIPVQNTTGTLHGLQFIHPDGTKKFKTGTDKAGCFHQIGTPNGRLYLCEGFATGCSIVQATDAAVFVAFDCGNLPTVASRLRAKYPTVDIIVCADNDHHTEGNPGVTKATEAAKAVNGKVAIPKFSDPASRGTDFNDLATEEGPEIVKQIIEAAAQEPSKEQQAGTGPATDNNLFISAVEALDEDLTVDYAVAGVMERDTIGEIFGPSGDGKTFIALDIALSIATGTPWNGRETERGIVLYLCGEGRGGFKRRIKAWLTHHGIDKTALSAFFFTRRTADLTTDMIKITAQGKELAASLGLPVQLIPVDTVARHLEGDENSTRDMTSFIGQCEQLQAPFPGSVVLLVHHSGQAEDTKHRSRGSSAKKAALDFEIRCSKGQLVFTKMKDAEEPEPIDFKLMSIGIGGVDSPGAPITSCYVEYGERSERNKATSFTGAEKTAIKSLIEVSAKNQERHGDLIGALVGDWRDAFYEARRNSDPDVKTHSLKIAFQRVQESLTSKAATTENGHARFLQSETHQSEINTLILSNNLTAAHGTKTAQSGTCAGHQYRHTAHTPIKECADVPSDVSPVPEYSELDFDMEDAA